MVLSLYLVHTFIGLSSGTAVRWEWFLATRCSVGAGKGSHICFQISRAPPITGEYFWWKRSRLLFRHSCHRRHRK